MARRAVRFLHKKGIGPLGEPALPFIKMDCSIGVMGKGTFRRNCLNLIQETERVINSAKSVEENCGRSFFDRLGFSFGETDSAPHAFHKSPWQVFVSLDTQLQFQFGGTGGRATANLAGNTQFGQLFAQVLNFSSIV
jgi:hypothetical protein